MPSIEDIDCFAFLHRVQTIVATNAFIRNFRELGKQFYGQVESVQKVILIDKCSPNSFADICLAVVKGMIKLIQRVINEKFYMILLLLLLFLLCSPVHSICHEYSYKSTDIHLHQRCCLQCIDLLTKKQMKVSLFCICEDVKLQNEIMKILLYFYELKWI
uniref:Uncharacterized protein n=1 Tax=Glossina palpalis gambiensis TaxID=67801 RepID=A0A1B0B141_9MUSC